MKAALIGGHSRSALALVRFARAHQPGTTFVAFVRRDAPVGEGAQVRQVSDYAEIGAADLVGCDAVINFVGATQTRDKAELNRVNAALPAALASAARAAGAGQFIHLSSLSLHGRAAWIGAGAAIAPVTDYGRSKADAENRLRELDADGFAIALLRIPAIYGPGAKSKIGTLAAALRRVPAFPVPATLPRRSVISHDNLARVLLELLASGRGGIVYAADPEPFDLPTFAEILPTRPRPVRVPGFLLQPLKALAPSLHNSLYEPMEIDPALLIEPERHPLRPTRASLADAFGGRPAQG